MATLGAAASFLRIVTAEDFERQQVAEDRQRELGPLHAQTLTEFFEGWFLPVILIGQHDDGPGAILPYREALKRWESITESVPIGKIDELVIAKVKAELRAATFQRGPKGTPRPVSQATVRKWQTCLRCVLLRLGPTNPWKPDDVCKGLLPVAPSLTVDAAPRNHKPKPAYTLDDARAVMRACDWITQRKKVTRRPGKRALIPTHGTTPLSPAWFRAWFGLLFYTGLRADKTALALRRQHCSMENGQWWLSVPAELVPKTDKPIRLPLHPCLVRLLEASHCASLANVTLAAHLCPWPMGYGHLCRLSKWIASKSGAKAQSPHAWRRTYGTLVSDATARHLDAAARALDHASSNTTAASYVNVEQLRAQELLRLPDLWPATPSRSASAPPAS